MWVHDACAEASSECAPEPMDSEDLLFLLYTSGSTGRPKGIVHTTGGYLVGAYLSTQYVFDLREDDVYWCTADVGWVTGHSYIVYGPLANGATVVMYEGAPNTPHAGRMWEIIDKHKVTIFYTAPTAIRAFMKWGDECPAKHKLDSLRLLGTVGEPINPEAWMWYHKHIGHERCPIVDTWWQTETGCDHDHAAARASRRRTPGSATRPFFGVDAGDRRRAGQGARAEPGRLPRAAQALALDAARDLGRRRSATRTDYWTKFKSMYFTGDGARRDEKGYFWILGRVDDVINVSGHRLSTMEVESALVSPRQGLRGGGRRPARRAHGPGDLRLRDRRHRARGPTTSSSRS